MYWGHERIEARLLLEDVGAGRLGRLAFERQVRTLVTPVLLRMTRLDALNLDAECWAAAVQLDRAEGHSGSRRTSRMARKKTKNRTSSLAVSSGTR